MPCSSPTDRERFLMEHTDAQVNPSEEPAQDLLVDAKADLEGLLADELPDRFAELGIDLSVFEDIHVMEPTFIDRVRR